MTSWFSEGAVTVTNGNTVVNGVGTKFSNCRAGDMFVGPDNGIYQVINPSSDTSVSISPAYRGATSAGAAYGIVPVNGYPKALADAVNQMVQQWGTTLAGLGSVSTENVVPVAKGGTGATVASTARTNLGLGTSAVAAVVGTVSQVGGVPTGALMESGVNVNGEFFKFACGTLICVKRNFNVAGFVIAPGAMGGSSLYPFPAAFIDVPSKSFSGYVSDGVGARTGIPIVDDAPMNGGSIDGWRFHIKNTTATNTQNIYAAHLIAIGRWFL